ncbi:HD-GYP domain-containing protein [Bacillus sp. HMF5848]|uniref:HD-GYP domain-containing protein n=1 Tax=Bacillus sp. HMF5848 TaxID=2495421 RepID=UPI000F79FB76|nr:HD-GYP domain-containing protein [Bacillus sp. HMF5848]RSK27659.1 HD-GYP domain-containing protein [Bacillus sp. HMF5848]
MRLVTVDRCQAGISLAKSISHENGSVLLAAGTQLTEQHIARLKKLQVFTIYIEDDDSEGIDIIDSIPEELRVEAVHVITEGLTTIAGLTSPHAPQIQGMMKTSRAIRSFQKIFRDITQCLKGAPAALQLLASTKIHDNFVYTHSLNVSIYACQLAIENGLPLKKIEEVGLGAMLHDIGTMFISPEILNKPGELTDREFAYVQSHTELGFDVLRKVHEVPLPVAHCALQHHERIDGTGYPRGLKADDIHPYAKLLSVVNVFEALTNHHPHRQAMLPHNALEYLYAGSATQFDKKQVQLFRKCIAIYPQGLTVMLNDGRTGIVSKYNFRSAGRPEIRIIRDEEGQKVTPYEIDLAANECLTVEIVKADALLY